ncbi:phage terminase small subunit [Bradyrhizobium sp. LM6.9]
MCHQRVEIGFLAFEAAVEGADGGTDFGAERFDRKLGEAAPPQHLRAGAQQRQRRLAAALLARRDDAGQVEITKLGLFRTWLLPRLHLG